MKHINKTNLGTHGFTLLELSVVLGIISVIIGSTITMTSLLARKNKVEKTIEKIEFIMQAIDDFADQNAYIPCPANPQSNFDDTDFGLGSDDGAGTCNASNLETKASGVLRGGAIPVNTLLIPPEYMLDAWGNRFTYYMDMDMNDTTVYADGTYTSNFSDGTVGDVQVAKMSGRRITNDALLIVISHGENGLGAYPGRGAATRISGAAAEEAENADIGATELYDCFMVGVCDDIVMYKMKWQLRDS